MAVNPFLSGNLEAEEEEAARRYAQLSQFERMAMDARQAQKGAVAGVETVGRGLLGLPPSVVGNREAAGQALRELAQKVRPGTAEFYTAAIDILREHGLVAEADAMATRMQEAEVLKAGDDPVRKAQRTLDILSRRLAAGDTTVEPAIVAVKQFLSSYGKDRTSQSADPEYIKLLNAKDAALKAGDQPRAAAIQKMIDALVAGKERSDVPAQRLAFDKTKYDVKTKAEDAAAISAVQNSVRLADNEIRLAQGVLTHPATSKVIGPRVGATELGRKAAAALSGDAANANSLLTTLLAQTFLRALSDLRATSKSSASGLGQLTEREGDKIQNAKAPLNPQQEFSHFKSMLEDYIAQLQTSRSEFEKALRERGAAVPAAPAPIQHAPTRPGVSDVAPSARPTPAPRPAPAPAPAAAPKSKYKAVRID